MIGEFSDVLIPDLPAPIVGYRAFWLRGAEGGAVVESFGGQALWPVSGDRTVEAYCQAPSYFKGAVSCTEVPAPPGVGDHYSYGCGIYAFTDLDTMIEQVQQPHKYAHSSRMYLLWAEVELWGRVYVHQAGYRAQFARVSSFLVPTGDEVVTEGIAKLLPGSDVPVKTF